MVGKEGYWLMDGRANYDVDAAIVLECCDTLAKEGCLCSNPDIDVYYEKSIIKI